MAENRVGRVAGKVAFITGAARGQGRSHAIRLAEEGADIVCVDLLDQMPSLNYPQGTAEDLAETVDAVKGLDRRIMAEKADVRERAQLRAVVEAGVAEFGRLDIVVCNAGILPVKHRVPMEFIDAVDVDLVGVFNTVAVTLPHLQAGASIVVTGSTAGLMPGTLTNPVLGPGGVGYGYAKAMIPQYVETLALQLAPHMIRVNAIHPTNVDTNLLQNADMYTVFRPDLEHPTREDATPAFQTFQAMPIPWIEVRDVSNAVVFLASDEARYITGQQLRVDAGAMLLPNQPG
jgi:SDR family mycofactocin-dependent oxidoreductase